MITLRVAEMFGPTFQGEGPSAGQQAAFVRLSGCGVGCGWCDEPQTWDWSRYGRDQESRPMAVDEVSAWVRTAGTGLAVITGGEPLAQRKGVAALAGSLTSAGLRVEVETSGTIVPGLDLCAAVSAFNVSPKLANSRVPYGRRIRPRALEAFAACGKAVFKFVACGADDLAEVADLAHRFGLAPVWIMPEGTSADEVLAGMRALADDVLERGWNLTGRAHVMIWDGARGR
jgi:7-carboxy-7-deazaguanine synthase